MGAMSPFSLKSSNASATNANFTKSCNLDFFLDTIVVVTLVTNQVPGATLATPLPPPLMHAIARFMIYLYLLYS